ncbi:MAG: hypothetical protein A2Y23_04610 [Clostridiales bacterium GWB2_37_7]|nr:MAG: hypothetical protein A2Y23_04610 [Clostridiales bacterium GWB2_37_7]
MWLPILAEHLKFHRNGIDPNIKQDCIFQNLDYSARQIEYLYSIIIPTGTTLSDISRDPSKTVLPQALAVSDIKKFMYLGIKSCEILSIIPSILADHMRRETDRFIGLIGGPKSTRKELGIPGGDKNVLGVPRMLLAELPDKEKFTAVVEEIMFFSHINEEHSHHIAMTAKPEMQEKFTRKAKEFEKDFRENLAKAKTVEERGKGLTKLVEDTFKLMKEFKSFGLLLQKGSQSCTLPGEQTNAWPLMDDHILREGNYFVELLQMAMRK